MSSNFLLKLYVIICGLALAASAGAQQIDADEQVRGAVFGADELPGYNDEDSENEDLSGVSEASDGDDSPGNDTAVISDFRKEDLDTDWEEEQPDQERDEQELLRSFELYKSSLENKMYDEADTLAKHIVELSIRLFGLDSHNSAKALTNLATVQFHNKDFESAQLNYTAAIEIIERIEDRLNEELINPLKGLGAAQLGAGRPDLAADTFDRAIHISHVNEGPHNLMQVEMLDALTETYLAAGDVPHALDVQENVVNLQMRNLDPNSEEILPALERQAGFMHRMQHYNAERSSYRRIIRILETTRGRNDLSLIAPLTGLGRSYLFVEPYDPEFQSYTPSSGGEVYLKRALRIAEDSPETSWQTVSKAMLALGDFYTLAGRITRAKRTYGETWQLLSEGEDRLASRNEAFESTVVLQSISPTTYYNNIKQNYGDTPPDQFKQGTIVVGYSIDKSGSPINVQLIEAQPPGLNDMENEVLRKVREQIYRPQFRDGELIDVDGVTYTHEFFYRESDLPAPDDDTDASASTVPDPQ
jgi:tetratricopeptide (TPR) repeat protein